MRVLNKNICIFVYLNIVMNSNLPKTMKIISFDDESTTYNMGKNYVRVSIHNFRKICRSCLFGTAVNNLFECEFEGKSLSLIYRSIFSIEIAPDDGLPNNVCEKCTKAIIEFNNFKSSVIDVQNIFKNLLERTVSRVNTIRNTNETIDEKKNRVEINYKETEDNLEPLDATNQNSNIKRTSFKCKYCKECFQTLSDYKKHTKLEKEKRKELFSRCPICKKLFNKSKLVTHIKVHSKIKETTFQCDICGKNYGTKRNLNRHYLSHTGLPHVCEVCGKGFREAHLLKEHLNIHNGISPYLCSLCGKSYPTSSALRLHRRYIHEGKKPKVYRYPKKADNGTKTKTQKGSFPCEICGKVYASRTIVNYHVLTHSEEKKFQCNDCGRMFANKSILGDHRRIHRLSYKCTYCDRSFAYATSLETHTNSHTGEKPHSCQVCGKRYSNRSHLREHQRNHTGERPYSCDLCGKTFAVRGNLNGHLKIHAKEGSFACSVCQKRFSNEKTFNRHSCNKNTDV